MKKDDARAERIEWIAVKTMSRDERKQDGSSVIIDPLME